MARDWSSGGFGSVVSGASVMPTRKASEASHAPSIIPMKSHSKTSELVYLPKWFFGARFLGRTAPLQTVLFVSNRCNLACAHCESATHANTISKPISQIAEELEYAYSLGSRFVDFEGGEPTIWSDGNYRINDLIALASQIGFFSSTVTTNAQLPFDGLQANSIWVSIDGTREYHDAIRGEGAFDRAMANIASSGHPAVSINMSINRINYECVADVMDIARDNPHVEMMSFSFHVPYRGTEDMMVDWGERVRILDMIISRKKAGYPIMNSVSAMELMKTNDFPKRCWVSNFILADGTRLDECPGKAEGICNMCGFGMGAEMHSVLTLRPDTIAAGLSLRVS